ncbi:MAG: superoxide dismutase family protein [Clostridia bacterium]|nr:superoxide dismutase family protein [Clostridia bacterium]
MFNNHGYNNWNQTAAAYILGGPLRPQISGVVFFRATLGGTLISVQISGLPDYKPATDTENPIGPYGFHLHENGTCEVGNVDNPFQEAGEHWNPTNQPHGNHAGDFPVLFSNSGRAYMSFFTNKFQVSEAVGKAVIIHENPDDYRTQPAGDAGKRLACGVVEWAEY